MPIRTFLATLAVAAASLFAVAPPGGTAARETAPDSVRSRLDSLFFDPGVEAAVEATREIVTRYPDSPDAWHTLGRLLLKAWLLGVGTDRLEEARAALERCLALEPEEAWMRACSHVSIARVFFETGRDSLARHHCNIAIQMDATPNATMNARRLLNRNRIRDTSTADWLTATSEHFEFHYPDSLFRADYSEGLDTFIHRYESAYADLAQFWGVEPDLPVRLYVYPDADHMEALTGNRSAHSFAERSEIHAFDVSSYGHELTHVFAYVVNPHHVGALLVEGIGIALDRRRTPLLLHAEAVQKGGDTPDPLLRIDTRFNYDTDYLHAASFVVFLIQEYGADRFLELYRATGPLETCTQATYDTSLADLEAQWRAQLARWYRLVPQMQRMGTAMQEQSYDDALAAIDSLIARWDDAPVLLGARARALMGLERYPEAIDALQPILDRAPPLPTIPWVLAGTHLDLGKCYEKTGDRRLAATHYRTVIDLDAAGNLTDDAKRGLERLDERED